MKEIFQRKSFWFILAILLVSTCIYPPFRLMTEVGITAERKWEFILTALPTLYEVPEIDLEMLFLEVIVAISVAIGISLILYRIKTALRRLYLCDPTEEYQRTDHSLK